MKNSKPNLCLDVEAYVKKKAKYLGYPHDEELSAWIDTFVELAEMSEQDISFRKLDQRALELYVQTVGASPLEISLMGRDDCFVVPEVRDEGRGPGVGVVGADSVDVCVSVPPTGGAVELTVDDLLSDFELFCIEAIRIKYRPGMGDHCENGGFGPFILTGAQKKVISIAIDLFFNKQVPVRLQILKSRQLGVTTMFLVFNLWLCYQIEGYTTMFMIVGNLRGFLSNSFGSRDLRGSNCSPARPSSPPLKMSNAIKPRIRSSGFRTRSILETWRSPPLVPCLNYPYRLPSNNICDA